MSATHATDGSGGFRELRRAAGLSQVDLAVRAECSVSMLRLIEQGYRPNGSEVIERISSVLGEVDRAAA